MSPPAESTPVLGERLARVEAQQERVLDDTQMLRQNHHRVAETVQHLVAESSNQSKQLDAILRSTDAMTTAITAFASLEPRIAAIEDKWGKLETQLASLITIASMGKGAWWALIKVAAIIAVIAGITPWIWSHIKVTP